MSAAILTTHVNFDVVTLTDHVPRVIDAAGSFASISLVEERPRENFTRLEFLGENTMEAAIFLATISADPERAAMFKMFWSGE